MFNIILTVILSLICSVAYRAGGMSKEQKYWIPVWMRKRWVRAWLCPLFALLPMFVHRPDWLFIPVYALTGAALTTYWDFLFKEDNFWFSGFMVGVAALPLLFCGFSLPMLILRVFLICVVWGFWCKIFSNDHIEEHGRGLALGLSSFII